MNVITKNGVLFFCALYFSISMQSQNKVIDSLKNELSMHVEKDTIRARLLNSLAFAYFSKDLSKTLEYLDESDEIVEATNFTEIKGRNIYVRGITEAVQGNFEKALQYYDAALKVFKTIDFKSGIANCYNAMCITFRNQGELRKSIEYGKKSVKIKEEIGSDNLSAGLISLGSTFQELGEYEESVLYLNRALSIAKANKNQQRVSYCFNNLAIVYRDQGNFPLALENYKEALYINEKIGDSLGIANVLSNIGYVYLKQKYYDKSKRSYEKSLEINKRIKSKKNIPLILNGIGLIHEEKKEYKSALKMYGEALNLSKEIGAKRVILNIQNNIGEIHLALKEYEKANTYFLKAEKSSKEMGDMVDLSYSYLGLAKVHLHQQHYKNALTYVLKSEEVLKKTGLLENQKEAKRLLAVIYRNIGDYKNAFESHQQYKKLNDSLFNKENIQKLTAIEYEYRYQQERDSAKIKELQLQKTVKTTNQKLEKTKQNFLYGIIGFLVLVLIMGALLFSSKLRNEKAKTQNAVIEQKLLRSQMTPHFIFNSLSVLQGLIFKKEEQNSITYLSKFSKLLRTTLENSRHKTVLLSEELAAIDDYMTLQNLDKVPPYIFTRTVAPEIDTTMFKIPPMLIQPFVENAIEHAFPYKKEDKEITVTLSYKNEELICTIDDNGIGIDMEKQKKNRHKNSLATAITSERLKVISKDLKKKGALDIKNKKMLGTQGTIVTLVIPYKMNSFV